MNIANLLAISLIFCPSITLLMLTVELQSGSYHIVLYPEAST